MIQVSPKILFNDCRAISNFDKQYSRAPAFKFCPLFALISHAIQRTKRTRTVWEMEVLVTFVIAKQSMRKQSGCSRMLMNKRIIQFDGWSNHNTGQCAFAGLHIFWDFLQKTAFSLVKSRLALGSSSWMFGCLFVTMPKMASFTWKWLWIAPPSDHIQGKKTFSRPDQERGTIGPASLLHSWRWVFPFAHNIDYI